MFLRRNPEMVTAERALPGRSTPVLRHPFFHRVFGDPLDRDFPGSETAHFALGCFWGAEKLYWNTPGVLSSASGYMGGYTPNPTYEETCSGATGHTETVQVVFDPSQVSYEQLVRLFFESHDPTQGFRQGNDVGTQYRSAIFTHGDEQAATVARLSSEYEKAFAQAGYPALTTEIAPAPQWYYAEDYHQQYLQQNPNGYCPIHSTGVTCG